MHGRLQHNLDHRVRGERAVQLVELLAAGGGDGDGHAQILAALALAQLNGGGIKQGVELAGDQGDGVHQTVHLGAHDFDGKPRRIGNERLGGYGHGHGWLRQWKRQSVVNSPLRQQCHADEVFMPELSLVSRATLDGCHVATWRHLMHTDLTILMSVRPIMIFSMPSIFKVRMPPSTAAAKISATRARSWISFLMPSSAISSSCRPMRPL